MAFLILRFAKHKGAPARAIEAHHERQKEHYKSNPDVKIERSINNIHIIKPTTYYRYEIDSRIKAANCRVRRDSTRFVDTLITASPEFFEDKSSDEVREFFKTAVDFMSEKLGKDNIFSAVVHLDEKTPHMHLCFVPLTEDNRLSAKDILGNRAKLSKWQDEFHEYMVKKYPDLERGISSTITKRQHIPTSVFKAAFKLADMQTDIETLLDKTNPLNASRNAKKVAALLEKWVPKVETFETRVRLLNKSLAEAERDNALLKGEVNEDKNKLFEYRMQISGLNHELSRLKRLYSKVPAEIREEVERKRKEKGIDR